MMPAIALVGMSCRYPEARSPIELWENVVAGRRAFRRLPPERLRLEDYFCPDARGEDTIYVTEAAVLEGYEFDRVRFRVAGSTFRSADMAHWLALEVAADALADAGFADAEGLPNDATGVLVGNSLTGEFSRANLMRLRWPYVRRVVEAALAERGWPAGERASLLDDLETSYKSPFPPVGDETLAGGLSNTIAGRICNYFDLGGGGYTVDGACASSLLAIATACSALTAGDLDVAVAGGVDLSLDPFELVGFSKVGALAAEEMRVYDARSAGFWPGEGCGFVVLMRYEDARRDHRRIHALVRGWGVSSDGSGGITRPEAEGQLLALRRAYRRAGFGIETVPYFEGHGTGTSVGDPTELQALASALRESSPCTRPAVIGSIKANIGHTKAAAGVAGVIKATMAVKHQLLPPGAGWQQPHPVLADQGRVLRLADRGEVWPGDRPLRAGVSAMGFGGINAHLVLEGVASRRRGPLSTRERTLLSSAQDVELLLLGAPDHEALAVQVRKLLSFASRLSRSELADLACELAASLPAGKVRAAIVASKAAELQRGLETLDAWLADDVRSRLDTRNGVMLGCGAKQPAVGYLFPGQGSPANVDGGAWVRRFESVAELYAEARLPAPGDGVATQMAQPAIVTASLAGLHVLDGLGIEASVAVGHSLGELTAYHWADVMDRPALRRMVAARGRAIADFGSPGGAMAGVAAGRDAVDPLIEGQPVVIAGLNSPGQTVVSGEAKAIEALVARARSLGLAAVSLPVSHAFHSPLVADSAPALARALAREQLHPPRFPVASTITATVLRPGEDLAALLIRQMTSPVRFMEAVGAVAGQVDLWIEVGPGRVLRGIAAKLVETPVVSLDAGGASLRDLMQAVGTAFALGAPINVRALFDNRFVRPFHLDWQPRFLTNPCELAPKPKPEASARVCRPEPMPSVPAAAREEPRRVASVASVLDVVRELAARRAELPLNSVGKDDRLLHDLHLSSLAVGQLVAEAARALDLPPPVSPTDAAGATIAEVASMLEQLARDGSAKRRTSEEALPPGVDSWTRAFTVELLERGLPPQRPAAASGSWTVIAPEGHPLKHALQRAFDHGVGGPGVIVCLPPEPEAHHVELLLGGARAVLAEQTRPRAEKADCRFVLVQHGGGGAAFARSLHLEMSQVTTCVVDVPADHPQAVDWVVAESRAAVGYSEAHYDTAAARREAVLRLLPLADEGPPLPLDPDDVMLVTGGGKGIAAECAFSLAKESGVRLALLGRSRPDADTELAANLRRIAAAGIEFHYVSADVTDPASVQAAVAEIEARLGPITAIVHGAGTNLPKRLDALDEDAVSRTLKPKVQGVRNVLAAVDPEPLRLLVTFGSIIARTGMHGQADYALANEWLTRLAERWHEQHPHCHCLAVEWSVWSGLGMGERLGTIDALRRQGIAPISPDEGVRLLRRLITTPAPKVAVVVTGRFGQPPTLKLDQAELPLLRFLEKPRVFVPGVELVADAELSTDTDPYLKDHVYQGVPLFLAVMGLEAMAQAATALTGHTQPPVFEDVQFHHPIVVPDGQRVTIRVAALVRQADRVEVVLRSQETGFQRDHFRATCLFGHAAGQIGRPAELLPEFQNGIAPVPLNPRRDLYGGILFHSGRFRRIENYRRLRATECVAEIGSAGTAGWFGPYLSPMLVLGDAAVRDAVIHAVQACIPQGTLLPIGIKRLIPAATTTTPTILRAQERSREGDLFVYDLEVTGTDGIVRERWEGLRLRRVGDVAVDATWAEPLLGPYVERRLAELIPGSKPSIVVERNGAPDRRTRGELAIRRAAGTMAAVHKRPDGKPEVCCGEEVSVSHADDLTMAVAAEGTVACDAQTVAPRPDEAWRDLLGPERHALSQLIVGGTEEDSSTAATRVWTAIECLQKAGAASDAPLVLHSVTEDDWVLLTAGRLSIATWIAPLRHTESKLALAVLVDSPPESP
ncbi:MAG: SDR family NAD(P)-dependent oxidoreductase [Pirellulales bacterium]|nr:SDR family NAD(P)-dependent oxidoreductase [Pirellulales bacterium]